MKILLITILGITLIGCNYHRENSKTVSSSKEGNETPIKEQVLGDNKWNWNERLTSLEKSEIKEMGYPINTRDFRL